MQGKSKLPTDHQIPLEKIFKQFDLRDYQWIDPGEKIIVSQWVRMKCMYGCGEYGNNACCPPNTPAVSECERFFKEYSDAVVFHFNTRVDKPEERHNWSKGINIKLSKLEREVFVSGHERAFMLFMDSCSICSFSRVRCKQRRLQKPGYCAAISRIHGGRCIFDRQIAVRVSDPCSGRILPGNEPLCNFAGSIAMFRETIKSFRFIDA